MSQVRLHFEPSLEYQRQAIEAVCKLFEGTEQGHSAFSVSLPIRRQTNEADLGLTITGSRNSTTLSSAEVLRNLQRVQEQNGLELSESLEPNDWNFTIEMETGTGKTYVYLRTIYELNKRYGFTKFVIVVPSIAIKEGVFKSMEMMEQHFRTLYDGVEMEKFLYDSSRLAEVKNYGNSSKLQIMVCTIQSITDIRTEAEAALGEPRRRGRRAQRVMYTEREQTGDRKPIEFIQQCRPIVIIDEPQNIGERGEENGIACLHPLCTLRYSATHTNFFHPIYSLNAVDASLQKLVKGIEVASVRNGITYVSPYVKLLSTSGRRGGCAKIELWHKTAAGNYEKKPYEVVRGDILNTISNCSGVYDDIVVQEVYQEYIKLSHAEAPLYVGQSVGDADEEQNVRAMVRATIREHMTKEVKLRPKGIKVLSLFFIDKVEDYRRYDENRNPLTGPLAQIFEEEYDKIMRLPEFRSLYDNRVPAACDVHNGYFSIDKGRRGQAEIWTDTAENNAANKEAAARAYELIMRDKERLLSLEEPLKFIFSHSALKEGWDNPNVFQVCVLRDMNRTITRRQALGRGLRICVDQTGRRVREEGINTLTVIAKEDFNTYAQKLQKEYEDGGVRFGFISKARLGVLEYTDAEGNPVRLGQELAAVVIADLQAKNLLTNEGKPTEELKRQLNAGTYAVPEACAAAKLQILARLKRLVQPIEIKDARQRERVVCRYEKLRLNSDFIELWERIKKKTTYRVRFGTEELVRSIVSKLDTELAKMTCPMTETTITQATMDENGISEGRQRTQSERLDVSNAPVGDILTSLEDATHLTRKTLARILTGTRFLGTIRYNGPLFEKIVQRVIKAELKSLMVKGVSYRPVTIGQTEYNAQEIFKDTEGYLDKMLPTSEKCLMNHVIWQSDVEREFATAAEASAEVKLYVKLPNDFRIPTPLGPYNPDWALVIEVEGKNHLYFVVETKSEEISAEGTLRTDEANKIRCARKHFDLVGSGVDNAASYLAPIKELSSVIAQALVK